MKTVLLILLTLALAVAVGLIVASRAEISRYREMSRM
ncbi:hypothetical protein SAMN05443637_1039 [Pseudonocardia thermophila]|jgi:hypothetical protein|uniref:Uncharacterized protein n=1 Tax=Pseudonocardia thermophila TaxID=1848 RepID=A0A1M6PZS4_PSETH|nr:hypothetical protein SAMN05443637_1039 [Pseudonocardia thermophila]